MWLWLQKLMKFFQGEEEHEETVEGRPAASPPASPAPRQPQAKTKSIYPKERVNNRNIDDVRPRRERQFRFPVVPDDYLENRRKERRNQQAADDAVRAQSAARERGASARDTLRPRDEQVPEKQAETFTDRKPAVSAEHKRDSHRRQPARQTESAQRTSLTPQEKKAYRPSEIVSPVYGKITPSTREAEHRIHTTGGVVYPRLEQEEHLQQIKQWEQEISERYFPEQKTVAQDRETDGNASGGKSVIEMDGKAESGNGQADRTARSFERQADVVAEAEAQAAAAAVVESEQDALDKPAVQFRELGGAEQERVRLRQEAESLAVGETGVVEGESRVFVQDRAVTEKLYGRAERVEVEEVKTGEAVSAKGEEPALQGGSVAGATSGARAAADFGSASEQCGEVVGGLENGAELLEGEAMAAAGVIGVTGAAATGGAMEAVGAVETAGAAETAGAVGTVGAAETAGAAGTVGATGTAGATETVGAADDVGEPETTGAAQIARSTETVGASEITEAVEAAAEAAAETAKEPEATVEMVPELHEAEASGETSPLIAPESPLGARREAALPSRPEQQAEQPNDSERPTYPEQPSQTATQQMLVAALGDVVRTGIEEGITAAYERIQEGEAAQPAVPSGGSDTVRPINSDNVPVSAEEEKQAPAYTYDVNRLLARAMPDAEVEASAAAQAASSVSEAAAPDALQAQIARPLPPVTELPSAGQKDEGTAQPAPGLVTPSAPGTASTPSAPGAATTPSPGPHSQPQPPAAADSQEPPYCLPTLALLNPSPPISDDDDEHTQLQKLLLEETLSNFNVSASVVGIVKGPSVTRFELQPAPGVKVNKITSLIDDIKLNLAAKDIRIEAPIPGRNAIGIEVPNLASRPVLIEKIIGSEKFQQHPSPLAVALGMDIGGEPIIADIKKMPHGLIAGSTGSGKSVCINSIIVSLLYKATPEQVRLLLIDPKMVELAPYNHLPHLVTPVVTEAKQATAALKWAVEEMEKRYALFVDAGVRDIDRYNQTTDDQLPYIVIIIDELADLMMVSPQDVEDCIIRIAQKARACGIHLLLATQRPSVDVITGNIKANVPTRLAFAVFSQVDSRTILDQSGAERLLGRGDMLFLESGTTPVRLQGNFVSDDEIERITQTIKKQRKPAYLFSKEDLEQQVQSYDVGDDPLYMEALLFVAEQGQASASGLQRRFRVGYNRAARLIEMMEADGYVAGQSGGKARAVLITREDAQAVVDGSTLL
ncbi:DNA translocase FtsK [Brevibacillus agri]|uniref:DNA translocase FtsK n=1 Tax=Brevibacillus agri TaxID=51101 RepID=UPI003D253089